MAEPPTTSPTPQALDVDEQIRHQAAAAACKRSSRGSPASRGRRASRCALFQDLKDVGALLGRFAADKPFDQILRDVAAHAGYAEIAQFYIADQHGDLRPVSSADELAKAFASWESSSRPRMRAKLASVVDETLEKLRSPDAERQLLCVLAAWELACEPASHERMDGDFFGALVEKLHSPHFAVATHAAAAIQIVRQTAARGALSFAKRRSCPPPSRWMMACISRHGHGLDLVCCDRRRKMRNSSD